MLPIADFKTDLSNLLGSSVMRSQTGGEFIGIEDMKTFNSVATPLINRLQSSGTPEDLQDVDEILKISGKLYTNEEAYKTPEIIAEETEEKLQQIEVLDQDVKVTFSGDISILMDNLLRDVKEKVDGYIERKEQIPTHNSGIMPYFSTVYDGFADKYAMQKSAEPFYEYLLRSRDIYFDQVYRPQWMELAGDIIFESKEKDVEYDQDMLASGVASTTLGAVTNTSKEFFKQLPKDAKEVIIESYKRGTEDMVIGLSDAAEAIAGNKWARNILSFGAASYIGDDYWDGVNSALEGFTADARKYRGEEEQKNAVAAESFGAMALAGLASNFPNTLMYAVAGITGTLPVMALPFAVNALRSMGDTYNSLTEDGVDKGVALTFGTIGGVINSAIETLQASQMMGMQKKLAGKFNLMRTINDATASTAKKYSTMLSKAGRGIVPEVAQQWANRAVNSQGFDYTSRVMSEVAEEAMQSISDNIVDDIAKYVNDAVMGTELSPEDKKFYQKIGESIKEAGSATPTILLQTALFDGIKLAQRGSYAKTQEEKDLVKNRARRFIKTVMSKPDAGEVALKNAETILGLFDNNDDTQDMSDRNVRAFQDMYEPAFNMIQNLRKMPSGLQKYLSQVSAWQDTEKVIIGTTEQLESKYRELNGKDIGENIENKNAFVDDSGRLWVNAENVSKENVDAILDHEVFGHRVLYDTILNPEEKRIIEDAALKYIRSLAEDSPLRKSEYEYRQMIQSGYEDQLRQVNAVLRSATNDQQKDVAKKELSNIMDKIDRRVREEMACKWIESDDFQKGKNVRIMDTVVNKFTDWYANIASSVTGKKVTGTDIRKDTGYDQAKKFVIDLHRQYSKGELRRLEGNPEELDAAVRREMKMPLESQAESVRMEKGKIAEKKKAIVDSLPNQDREVAKKVQDTWAKYGFEVGRVTPIIVSRGIKPNDKIQIGFSTEAPANMDTFSQEMIHGRTVKPIDVTDKRIAAEKEIRSIIGDSFGTANVEVVHSHGKRDGELWYKQNARDAMFEVDEKGVRVAEPEVEKELTTEQREGEWEQVSEEINSEEENDSLRFSVSDSDKNLLVAHNLSESKLRHAARMGGFPIPSLAIIRTDKSTFDNFGEISLITGKEIIDPQRDSAAKTFDADVYSPRYPSVTYKVNAKKYDELFDRESPAGLSYPDVDSMERDGFRRIAENRAVAYDYLESIGKAPELFGDKWENDSIIQKAIEEGNLSDGLLAWAQEQYAGIIEDEKISNGYTNAGKRRYLPHNLDTVVKLMKKSLRDGENFNYGVGSIRSNIAKKFRSVKDIRNSQDRIVTEPEFEAVKKEINEEFAKLSDYLISQRQVKPEIGAMDAITDDIKALATGDRKYLATQYQTTEPLKRMGEFLDKLRNLPTEYFESKIQRVVGLNEFAGALVPEDVSADVEQILKKNGIEVEKYKKNDKEDRKNAVDRLSEKLEIKFSIAADTRYLDLAKDPEGNRDELQRMVDEKVKQKNGIRAYHGTDAPEFTEFKTLRDIEGGKTLDPNAFIGSHFSKKRHVAENFAESLYDAKNGRVMDVVLTLKNPLQVGNGDVTPILNELEKAMNEAYAHRAKAEKETTLPQLSSEEMSANVAKYEQTGNIDDLIGEIRERPDALKLADEKVAEASENFARAKRENRPVTERELLEFGGFDYDKVYRAWTDSPRSTAKKIGRTIRQKLIDAGYDGVVYSNAMTEETGLGFGDNNVSYIALYPQQIKSADPVTYDDAGNVIPLSERFNPEKTDIRFSISEEDNKKFRKLASSLYNKELSQSDIDSWRNDNQDKYESLIELKGKIAAQNGYGYFHGTSDALNIDDGMLLSPDDTNVISEDTRKKNLNKVFFTPSYNSAMIYAGRAVSKFGGNPVVYYVKPQGELETINATSGTEVMMADSAIARTMEPVVLGDNGKVIAPDEWFDDSRPDIRYSISKKEMEEVRKSVTAYKSDDVWHWSDGYGMTSEELDFEGYDTKADALEDGRERAIGNAQFRADNEKSDIRYSLVTTDAKDVLDQKAEVIATIDDFDKNMPESEYKTPEYYEQLKNLFDNVSGQINKMPLPAQLKAKYMRNLDQSLPKLAEHEEIMKALNGFVDEVFNARIVINDYLNGISTNKFIQGARSYFADLFANIGGKKTTFEQITAAPKELVDGEKITIKSQVRKIVEQYIDEHGIKATDPIYNSAMKSLDNIFRLTSFTKSSDDKEKRAWTNQIVKVINVLNTIDRSIISKKVNALFSAENAIQKINETFKESADEMDALVVEETSKVAQKAIKEVDADKENAEDIAKGAIYTLRRMESAVKKQMMAEKDRVKAAGILAREKKNAAMKIHKQILEMHEIPKSTAVALAERAIRIGGLPGDMQSTNDNLIDLLLTAAQERVAVIQKYRENLYLIPKVREMVDRYYMPTQKEFQGLAKREIKSFLTAIADYPKHAGVQRGSPIYKEVLAKIKSVSAIMGNHIINSTDEKTYLAMISKIKDIADFVDEKVKAERVEKLRDKLIELVDHENKRIQKSATAKQRSTVEYEYNKIIKDVISPLFFDRKKKGNKNGLDIILPDPDKADPRDQNISEESVEKILSETEQFNIATMSEEQLRDYIETITGTGREGRLIKKLQKQIEKAQFEANCDEMVAEAQAYHPDKKMKRSKDERAFVKPKKTAGIYAKVADIFHKGLLRPEVIIEEIVGFVDGSKVKEKLFDIIVKGKNAKQFGVDSASKAFLATWGTTKTGEVGRIIFNYNSRYGEAIDINIDNAMFVYAHTKNPRNMEHLKATFEEVYNPDGTQRDVISEIVNALPAEYRQVVDNQIKYFDEVQYPKINEVFKRIYGYDMAKEEYYFPITSLDIVNPIDAVYFDLMKRNNPKAAVTIGSIKGRTGSVLPLTDGAYMETVMQNMANVEHFVAMNEAVNEVRRYLSDNRIKDALMAVDPFVLDYLNNWIKDVAYGRISSGKSKVDRIMNPIRANCAVALLGWNAVSIAKQLGSITTALPQIGISDAFGMPFYAMEHFLTTMYNVPARIMGKDVIESTFAANRARTAILKYRETSIDREFVEMKEGSGVQYSTNKRGEVRRIARFGRKALDVTRSLSLYPMTKLDSLVCGALWNAKYNTTMAFLKGSGMTLEQKEAEAIMKADELIRKTQTIGDVEYLPAILKGGAYQRSITMFMNQNNNNLNLFYTWYKKARKGDHKFKSVKDAAMYFIMTPFIMVLAGTALLDWDLEKEDLEELGRQCLVNAIGGVPAAENIAEIGLMTYRQKYGAEPGSVYNYNKQVYKRLASILLPTPAVSAGFDIDDSLSAYSAYEASCKRLAIPNERHLTRGRAKLVAFLGKATGLPVIPVSRAMDQYAKYEETRDWRYLVLSNYKVDKMVEKAYSQDESSPVEILKDAQEHFDQNPDDAEKMKQLMTEIMEENDRIINGMKTKRESFADTVPGDAVPATPKATAQKPVPVPEEVPTRTKMAAVEEVLKYKKQLDRLADLLKVKKTRLINIIGNTPIRTSDGTIYRVEGSTSSVLNRDKMLESLMRTLGLSQMNAEKLLSRGETIKYIDPYIKVMANKEPTVVNDEQTV